MIMSYQFGQLAAKCFKTAVVCSLAGFVAFLTSASTVAEEVATGINYEKDSTNIRTLTFDKVRNARFCELFFIKVKGDMKELHVYNPTSLNNMAETGDSCPDSLVNKIDLKGLKEHFNMDGIYFNKPRHWIVDKITLPVGAKRKLGDMEWYWMAASHMPAKTEMKPGFLTYKHVPVERKSTIIFRAGNQVYLLDDPEGKTWVMKTYRDDHGQTYENIKDVGSRYKKLPDGYRFRVETLKKDLVLKPTEGTATVMQDEFENTFDYLGDGSSNYVP
jgi:hypothetical protein